MQNQSEAVARKLADPDYLMRLVRGAISVAITLSIAVSILAGFDIYREAHPTPDHYFYTDGRGTPYEIHPLDGPVMSDAKLKQWAVESVIAAFSVDFKNYAAQFSKASERFSNRGWGEFSTAFIQTGNFEKLKQARLLSSAQPERAALMRERPTVVDGRLTYRIEFPMLVTYENENQLVNQHLAVSVVVVRTPENEHADGIAIDQINAPPV